MHARFLGKDPDSNVGDSPTLFASDQAPAVKLPGYDYWLFDSSKLVRMRFDGSDRFIGGESIEDPTEIVKANYWRDAAWHKAVRRDDFAGESSGTRA